MNKFLKLLGILTLVVPHAVYALDSDRQQPATVDAEEVDIDFKTGKRIYTGNVKLRQGSIKLDADKLEVYIKNEQLEKAIAVGNPASFQQRPEGKSYDVIGRAIYIHLDEVNNVVTLTKNATVIQGSDTVSAKTIIYDMANDKVKLRGGTTTTASTESETAPAQQPSAAAGTASSEASSGTAEDGTPKRAKIRLKPQNAE